SGDGGETWEYFSAVKRPAGKAVFYDFVLSAEGKGRVTMNVTQEGEELARGEYVYRAGGGAKTWTGPAVEGAGAGEGEGVRGEGEVGSGQKGRTYNQVGTGD